MRTSPLASDAVRAPEASESLFDTDEDEVGGRAKPKPSKPKPKIKPKAAAGEAMTKA